MHVKQPDLFVAGAGIAQVSEFNGLTPNSRQSQGVIEPP